MPSLARADNSRTLCKPELTVLLGEMGLETDAESMDAAFTAIDRDQNGLISFPEFLKWLQWLPTVTSPCTTPVLSSIVAPTEPATQDVTGLKAGSSLFKENRAAVDGLLSGTASSPAVATAATPLDQQLQTPQFQDDDSSATVGADSDPAAATALPADV